MSITRRAFLGSSVGAVGLGAAGAADAGQRHRPIPMPDAMELKDLATPALVVDVGLMEANLRALQAFHADTAVSLRPHAKTHKCPVIARRQIELGAVGIAVAKISEAEVMVEVKPMAAEMTMNMSA